MNLLEVLADPDAQQDARNHRYGVVIGVVSNNKDPDKLGRVKVKFPWLVDDDESDWARIVAPMAGAGYGVSFLPAVGDEVLIAFAHGDPRAPYVVGGLWNGKDKPPSEKDGDGNNRLLIIKSRSNHVIILDDTPGSEKIRIEDKTGGNKLVIDSSAKTLSIQVDGDIQLKASSGKIVLDAQSVEIKASQDAKVTAGSTLDIKGSAATTIKGTPVNIN
jgi:uncharacterized protein involved in type VI secretion and phage assembly